MIQLFLDSTQVGAAGAVKVRWCVPRSVLDDAIGRKEAVWLLLCVASEKSGDHHYYQSRQMVQLNAGATFVSFKKAGINRVFAKIHYGDKKSAQRALERPEYGLNDAGSDWNETSATVAAAIVECEAGLEKIGPAPVQPEPAEGVTAEPVADPHAAERQQLTTRLEQYRTTLLPQVRLEEGIRGVTDPVDVPADCFAKEWPEWLNNWLRFISWGGRPLDECNRRRRALFSFTIQPFLVVLLTLIRIVVASFFALIGFRGTNYRAIISPVKCTTEDIYKRIRTPFWVPETDYVNGEHVSESPKRWLLAPLAPFLLLICAGIVAGSHFGKAHFAGAVLIAIGALLLSTAIVAAIAVCWTVLALVIIHFDVINPVAWLRYFFSGGSPELSQDDVTRLECDGDCIPTDRKERKTIRLWYLDLKSKVCKPLQG